jgi:hypothetical protein
MVSMEAALEQGAKSDQEDPPGGSHDDETASDNGGRVKIGAKVALAGISYDVGKSGVTKAHIDSLESFAHYFLKGYGRAHGAESVPNPHEDKAVVFEDFFAAGLRMPLHPVLLDILRKYQVQLHQLTPNVIVQIGKFVWAVTSCRGHPTADIFAHHNELHYQNKKIHLEGPDTNFVVQFGCITFHPSRFGNWARLTPAMMNKWMSG